MTTQDPSESPAPAFDQSAARQRWLRLIIALVVLNALILLGILTWRWVSPDRVTIEPVDPSPTTMVGNDPEAGSGTLPDSDGDNPTGPDAGGDPASGDTEGGTPLDPAIFLVMGSDSREDLPEELGITDQVIGHRADVIMIAAFDGERVRLLSLPRDLRVDINGGTRKLNAAYAIDGPNPQLLFETVVKTTGIDIDYYIEMDFAGFAGIVDGLGGVEITFPYPARDLKSHLEVGAGPQHLDGKAALAYARSRQYQEYRNDAWVHVDGSDIGRIGRQQSLIFAMLASAQRLSVFDPLSVSRVLRAVGSHVRVDARLTDRQLISYVLEARNLGGDDIEVVDLPVRDVLENGAAYVVADPDGAAAAYRYLMEGSAGLPAVPPIERSFRVEVLNGNGGEGMATRWGDRLRTDGFTVRVGDAGAFDFPVTVVTVHPDELHIGTRVVDSLGFGEVRPGSVAGDLDAVVIIGADALGR